MLSSSHASCMVERLTLLPCIQCAAAVDDDDGDDDNDDDMWVMLCLRIARMCCVRVRWVCTMCEWCGMMKGARARVG